MPVTTATTATPACVGEYAEHCRAKKLSDRYVVQVETLLTRFFAHVGDSNPATVEPADIEAWLEFRSNVEHCSGKTHNNEKAALSAFFHWARKTERCRVNPCLDVQSATAAPRIEYDYLTVEEVRRLLAVALADEAKPLAERRSDHNRSRIYRVAYATGLRCGSLRAARVGDFMDGKAQPTLKIRAIKHKTRKPHEVPLTAEGVEVFRELCAGRDHRDLLFERFPHARVIRADFREAGIRGPGGLQRFRVTVATMLADAGARPEAAQAMLGHAHISTTLKHYTRSKKKSFASEVSLLPDLADDSGDRIDGKVRKPLDREAGIPDTHGVTAVEGPMPTRPHDCERGTGREIPGHASGSDKSALAPGGTPGRFPGRDPERKSIEKCRRQESNLSPRSRNLTAGRDAEPDPDCGPRTRKILIYAERASAVVADARRGGASRPALDALTAHATAAWVAVRDYFAQRGAC